MDMSFGEQLQKNLEKFISHIDSIRNSLEMTMLLIKPFNDDAINKYNEYIKNNTIELLEENGRKGILIKSDESNVFRNLERNAVTSKISFSLIPESLFVSLVSQYDAYLNRLLKIMFEVKPEILNGSDRNLSFSQLVKMSSISEAREYVIEKEIDNFLRKSHSEQFIHLQTLFSIKPKDYISSVWQTFIELTERRNLLVHCDGIVNNNYIKNCMTHSCNLHGVELGKKLKITYNYFTTAYNCLFEISTKLTHILWRKLLQAELELADQELNEICFHLMIDGSFDLSDKLLQFACEMPRHSSERHKNILYVNQVISQYLQGNSEKVNNLLNKKDWSSTGYEFKLAVAVLKEDYEEAYNTMIKIGDKDVIDKSDYKKWPLFTKIRNEVKFKDVYKSIFKEEYSIMEVPKRPIQYWIENDFVIRKETIKETDDLNDNKNSESN